MSKNDQTNSDMIMNDSNLLSVSCTKWTEHFIMQLKPYIHGYFIKLYQYATTLCKQRRTENQKSEVYGMFQKLVLQTERLSMKELSTHVTEIEKICPKLGEMITLVLKLNLMVMSVGRSSGELEKLKLPQISRRVFILRCFIDVSRNVVYNSPSWFDPTLPADIRIQNFNQVEEKLSKSLDYTIRSFLPLDQLLKPPKFKYQIPTMKNPGQSINHSDQSIHYSKKSEIDSNTYKKSSLQPNLSKKDINLSEKQTIQELQNKVDQLCRLLDKKKKKKNKKSEKKRDSINHQKNEKSNKNKPIEEEENNDDNENKELEHEEEGEEGSDFDCENIEDIEKEEEEEEEDNSKKNIEKDTNEDNINQENPVAPIDKNQLIPQKKISLEKSNPVDFTSQKISKINQNQPITLDSMNDNKKYSRDNSLLLNKKIDLLNDPSINNTSKKMTNIQSNQSTLSIKPSNKQISTFNQQNPENNISFTQPKKNDHYMDKMLNSLSQKKPSVNTPSHNTITLSSSVISVDPNISLSSLGGIRERMQQKSIPSHQSNPSTSFLYNQSTSSLKSPY